MKYGHFDDKNKEYVITRPDTPLPWINYLGNKDFFGIISNTAGGYCFYRDARYRRITRYRYNNIPRDSNGRYLYIKDEDLIWSPSWKPVRTELDSYECRHGLGYTKLTAEKKGLRVSLKFFVPIDANCEIWDVTIENLAESEKSISIWSFVEWCLWDALDDMTNFQRNYNIGEVAVADRTIFHKTEYRERRNHYAYFACNRNIAGFDTDRDSFLGIHQGLERPEVVEKGKSKNSIAHGWSPVGVHQLDFKIGPGDQESVAFLLGYAENQKDEKFEAPGVINKEKFNKTYHQFFANRDKIDTAFEELSEYWESLLSNFKVDSEDKIIDRMANIWNQYQCMVTFNLSRSVSFYESGIGRGMGFRDSNQDILGFVHMIPKRARQRILDLASTQLADGSCYHQYQPLTKEGNSEIGGGFFDDHLWLILSTAAYLKETGDFSILKENCGFTDRENSKATLLDHLDLCIQFTREHLGPHGLPLIGHADWNDCMNLNCFSENPDESFQLAGHNKEGDVAESLMIAGLFCRACNDLADIYGELEQEENKEELIKIADQMKVNIHEHGWDGNWFLRAYDANGNKIGSSHNQEGQIFIESQGWCIMGGAGLDNDYAKKALDSVEERLATPEGLILHQPAYQEYHLNLGEISSYPPGYKENAGIFTHNNTWIQIAETMLGNGNRAMEYYKSICPPLKEQEIEIYRSEPYVYSQFTAGPDAATAGEGKNSWLTGTAAWSFVTLSQYILGIKPDYKGLLINPCLPEYIHEYTVIRRFRKAKYIFTIENPKGVAKGIQEIRVDGELISSNLIPVFEDNQEHHVRVLMG